MGCIGKYLSVELPAAFILLEQPLLFQARNAFHSPAETEESASR
jgi:hypothetical protein